MIYAEMKTVVKRLHFSMYILVNIIHAFLKKKTLQISMIKT